MCREKSRAKPHKFKPLLGFLHIQVVNSMERAPRLHTKNYGTSFYTLFYADFRTKMTAASLPAAVTAFI